MQMARTSLAAMYSNQSIGRFGRLGFVWLSFPGAAFVKRRGINEPQQHRRFVSNGDQINQQPLNSPAQSRNPAIPQLVELGNHKLLPTAQAHYLPYHV